MSAEAKAPVVGEEVLTECGKCKSEMHHVITAVKDDKIAKVMCKGCDSEHKYKAPKATKAKGKSKAKAADSDEPKAPKKISPRRKRTVDWDTRLSRNLARRFRRLRTGSGFHRDKLHHAQEIR